MDWLWRIWSGEREGVWREGCAGRAGEGGVDDSAGDCAAGGVRDRVADWGVVGSALPSELDGDCGDFAGGCGGVFADLCDGFAVFEEGSLMREMASFNDEDFRRTILRALRLLAGVTVVVAPILWWKLGWQSAVLLLVGAAISGSGLFEWLRLMTAVMARMDGGAKAKPMGMVLVGFFLRLGLTVVLLYVSLKVLNGSVYALAGGLALGVFALSVEGLRLMKAWTV